jgi:hypothetical protein
MLMTGMNVVRRSIIAALGFSLAGLSQTQRITSEFSPWPFSLEESQLPFTVEGTANFRVSVQAGTVVSVEPIGDAKPALTIKGRATLLQWRFDPTVTATFETAFRHRLEGESGCEQDLNQTVNADFPTLIEVTSRKFLTMCDSAAETVELHKPLSMLVGRLVCDCPSKEPIPGALLVISRSPDHSTLRSVSTNGRGEFSVHGLAPGNHEVAITVKGYQVRTYQVVIDSAGSSDPFDFSIQPKAPLESIPIVVAGSVPVYPEKARVSGVQGKVRLRVSLRHNEVIDIDAEAEAENRLLADAAIANLRTWRFRPSLVPVLTVDFSYEIRTTDCGANSRPTVRMELPSKVRVIAPAVACGPQSPVGGR